MSWLSSFLHPGKGYQKGQQQLDKYYGQANDFYNQGLNQAQNFYNQGQGYLNPYNQQGQAAYGNVSGAMNAFLDPQALQDKWASGYKESEAAKNLEGMAQEHGLNAASSMGIMGSTPALQAIQAGTSQIGAQDRQNYLNDLMQKYLAGAGLAQGIYGQGANAAGQMGQNAMGMGTNFLNSAMNMGQNAMTQGQNSAQMAYNKQNAGGNMLSGLIGQGIGLVGSALGGPMGGALAKRWSLGGG